MRIRILTAWLAWLLVALPNQTHAQTNVWQLAKDSASFHRFATIFTAQDVHDRLSTEADVTAAIEWCKASGITHVYLEEFRDNYMGERKTLETARDRFRAAGFLVSGSVTTTMFGKPSSGWGPAVCCYTDQGTQARLQSIFEYAASMFDDIIIDDYYFCDCTCPECDAARQARRVTVGAKSYPVDGDNWGDYHRALMVHVSQDRVLAPARKANPKVHLTIKYPQWYDAYQERGYDVALQTAAFDKIYVGTETRDYTNEMHWGGTVQYEGYFLMRWLGEIAGEKAGGGWYDSFGTTPPYYLEQARQTILAGARESLLFCYGALNLIGEPNFPPSMPWPTPTGPSDTAALRANLPELLSVAREVQRRKPIGIALYKPINSPGGADTRIFDFLGMMGLPLVPCHLFPTNAPSAIVTLHAYADPNLASEITDYAKGGHPLLMSGNLGRLIPLPDTMPTNIHVINFPRPLDYLLVQRQTTLDDFRATLLAPLHVTFSAPDMVGLYLFSPNGWVVENFKDEEVTAVLNGNSLKIPPRGWVYHWD